MRRQKWTRPFRWGQRIGLSANGFIDASGDTADIATFDESFEALRYHLFKSSAFQFGEQDVEDTGF